MMKARLLMIAAAGLLIGACNRQASAPAAPKTDLDRFQGTWYLVKAMQDGKSLPEDKVKQTTIVFKGDTFRYPGSVEYATSKEGTIKLDETKTPKEMDVTSTEKVMLGIYALHEGGYKVCFAPAGKPRPTALGAAPGTGYIHPPGLGAAEESLTQIGPRLIAVPFYFQTSPMRLSRLRADCLLYHE
jgi:uncharacterized protein (TIGR03067 family)